MVTVYEPQNKFSSVLHSAIRLTPYGHYHT